MTIDEKDYIVKSFYSREGKHKPQRWFMHYCTVCNKKRSYLPRNRVGKCLSCASIGKQLSLEHKDKIANSLKGNKNNCNRSSESRLQAVKKSWITRKNKMSKNIGFYKDKYGASKLKITIEEYREIKDTLKINRKIAHNMRSQLSHLLKNTSGKMRYIDWSVDELKKHLESKFLPGMTWDNYGRREGVKCWEIDHIIPIRAKKQDGSYVFNNLSDPQSEDFKKCFGLQNLQPLWAKDNLSKGNKLQLVD